TAAASRPASVYTPAAQEEVDRFGSSALAPTRPTIAPARTTRCPRRIGRLLPLPAVRFAAFIGECQNILTVHLVVQGIETEVGRLLRFVVQRSLQLLNTCWGC